MSNINFIVINDGDKLKDILKELIREEDVEYGKDEEAVEVWPIEPEADDEDDESSSTPKPMRITEETKQRVTRMIRDLGVPANLKGYTYLRDAIFLAISRPDSINSVTKVMYPEIARMNQTSPTRVERAIRHAIEVAWAKENNEFAEKFFGYTLNLTKGKPTNSECIALIADSYRMGRDLKR